MLIVLAVGTLVPLAGLGLPRVGLPAPSSIDGVHVSPRTWIDLPGWADGVLAVVRPIKNALVALLVLAGAYGEFRRRRRGTNQNAPGEGRSSPRSTATDRSPVKDDGPSGGKTEEGDPR